LRQNQEPIETGINIVKLTSFFKDKPVFTTQDLERYFKKNEGSINRNTLNWRVHYLVGKGVMTRTGRGQYVIGNGNTFEPELSPLVVKISKQLKKSFPYLKTCVWDMEQIRALSQHLPSLKLTIVDTERDGMESVFHKLQDSYENVFLKPDKEVMDRYVIPAKDAIIVKALVSEAPVREVNGIVTGAIEKILVDVFFEEEFSALRGAEMVHIFGNAFERYPVNKSRLLRYASRKRRKEEIEQFLKSNKLAAK
jgi:hypothetical protein